MTVVYVQVSRELRRYLLWLLLLLVLVLLCFFSIVLVFLKGGMLFSLILLVLSFCYWFNLHTVFFSSLFFVRLTFFVFLFQILLTFSLIFPGIFRIIFTNLSCLSFCLTLISFQAFVYCSYPFIHFSLIHEEMLINVRHFVCVYT